MVNNFKDFFKNKGIINLSSPLVNDKKNSVFSKFNNTKNEKISKIKYENSFSCKDSDIIEKTISCKEIDNECSLNISNDKKSYLINEDISRLSSNMSMKKIELFK